MAHTNIKKRKFKLRKPEKIGVDCHVVALADKYPTGATLDQIVTYIHNLGIRDVRPLKPQSQAVLAYNIKKLIIEKVGIDYDTDLPTKFAIDSVFQKFSLNKYRNQYRVEDVPSLQDVHTLITEAGLRTSLISAFLYMSGMRVSEMCRIRLEDLVLEAGCYRVKITQKGGSKNDPIVRKELIDQVRLVFKGRRFLFETRAGIQYNRKTVSAMIRAEAERLVGKRITAHSLRHAFATHMVQKGEADIAAISRQLGHSSPSTTLKMYVHSRLSPDQLPDIGLG